MAREPDAAPSPIIVDETKPYPDTGPLAVAARIALIGCFALLVYATVVPADALPQLVYSNNLEHFAAFYIAALVASAAFPRRRLRWLAAGFCAFALILEGARLLEFPDTNVVEKWCADVGGMMAAYAPMVVQRFRSLFRKTGP